MCLNAGKLCVVLFCFGLVSSRFLWFFFSPALPLGKLGMAELKIGCPEVTMDNLRLDKSLDFMNIQSKIIFQFL